MQTQMVQQPWGVTAYGAASVKAVPDLVRVRFKVARLEPTAATSFAVTGAAVQAVRQALRQHSVPDSAVNSSRLRLRTEWDYGGGNRSFLGYQCEAAFAIETRELDGAEQLLVDLVAAGADEIEGVEFDVVAKPELRAQARREAVAAAQAKAQLYADAAEVRLGRVLHIEDVNPEELHWQRGHAAAAEASAENLAPGHVVVSAAVVLGFAIAP